MEPRKARRTHGNSSLPAGAEVYRHKAERRANWPDHIKWSETLKNAALRGETLKLDIAKIVRALYRPQRLCHRAVPRALCRPSITREDVFHYLYALLHHPVYRERFAANLKRELPRIPFAPDFQAFAEAGRELARLHVDYESLPAWPLQAIENDSLPYSERVTKMKLSENRDSIRINDSLTLTGIPPETLTIDSAPVPPSNGSSINTKSRRIRPQP